MIQNNFKHPLKANTIRSIYKLIFCFIFSISSIQYSEGKIRTSQSPNISTIISYGACEGRGDTEHCKHPDQCQFKDIGDGICRPSCGYLASLSEDGKYGGYGQDNEYNTADDPFFLTEDGVSCEELDRWGATDWRKIPLVESIEPHEVAKAQEEGRDIECCGSDQQVEENNNLFF